MICVALDDRVGEMDQVIKRLAGEQRRLRAIAAAAGCGSDDRNGDGRHRG